MDNLLKIKKVIETIILLHRILISPSTTDPKIFKDVILFFFFFLLQQI